MNYSVIVIWSDEYFNYTFRDREAIEGLDKSQLIASGWPLSVASSPTWASWPYVSPAVPPSRLSCVPTFSLSHTKVVTTDFPNTFLASLSSCL